MEKADRSTNPTTDVQRLTAMEAEIRDCLPAFPILRSQLHETVAQVEQAVVGVCESFQSIVTRARTLVASATDSLSGDSAKGAPDRTSQALLAVTHGMLDRTEAANGMTLLAVQKMGQVEEQMEHITVSLQDVDDIAKALRLLGLNATIEAARAGEHGRTFGVVAAETTKLAGVAAQISKSIQKIVEQLRGNIDDTSKNLRAVSTALVKDSQTSRADFDYAVGAMARTEEELRGCVEKSARSTEALADDIDRAVIAMQFQDSMSQQVTHVVDALGAIEQGLAEQLDGHDAQNPIAKQRVRRDLAGHLKSLYTMQSERIVHAALVGIPEGAGTTSLGDNVEFF
jgi:methyl-accepting chemotaxis protein